MTISPGVGDAGIFFRDAAAHTSGVGLPARLIALHSGDTTCSIVVDADPPIPYGPVAPPFPWTADPTEVALASSPSGYYFLLTEAVQALDVANGVNAVSAAAAQATADLAKSTSGLELTPLPVVSVVPGSWTFDPGLELWHERFSKEQISFYYPAPLPTTQYRVLVKDVVGSAMSLVMAEAEREDTAPFTALSFSTIGTANSDGTGSIQEVTISGASSSTRSQHRLTVVTGLLNGGVAVADQYHVYQVYRIL